MIEDKKIVICTLCFCTRLTLYHMQEIASIFIDEAGQARENETVIPFTLNNTSHIVLSGDPLQLGPVVKSELAKTIMGTSLLERLMNSKLYRNSNTNVVVQLINNYRSHREIIGIANSLYYGNKLKSFGYQDKSLQQLWTRFAPEKFSPIIFIDVAGKEAREKLSKSLSNEIEIEMVLSKVRELLKIGLSQEKIGIITPLSIQSRKIEANLKEMNLSKIEVGTTEQYQGREKEIVIFSAVRSKKF